MIIKDNEDSEKYILKIINFFSNGALDLVLDSIDIFYKKQLYKKLITFFEYSNVNNSFLKEIENNKKLYEYLCNYFDSIRITPSILAIKTMAIIFKKFKNDSEKQQRAYKAFTGIIDIELDNFIILYENMDNKKYTLNLSENNSIKFLKNNYNFKFYLNDLANRGFFFLKTNTGFINSNSDFNFMFTVEFDDISTIYYDCLIEAKNS